jgi:hypothetical protein
MPPDLSRVARCVADTRNDDDCCAGKHGTATAAGMPGRADSAAWQAMRTPPFQFIRWLAALTTVVADWLAAGTPRSLISYAPVLMIVALLLLPDARSIKILGVKFERLTSEVTRQGDAVDRLAVEVSQVSNSLAANSQVNIAFGGATTPERTPAGVNLQEDVNVDAITLPR